jgi:hypothetical protein
MKKILIPLLLISAGLFGGCNSMLAKRNTNDRLPVDIAGILASNRVAYVAGGESVQTAVTDDVLKALAQKKQAPNEAAYFRYTQFGQDTAPDQPVADTQAIEGKNSLDAAMKAFGASKSPQAAAALAALSEASKIAQNLTRSVPQGDRSGGNQLVAFVGASSDASEVAKVDSENIAAMRLRQFPRANASTTTTNTRKDEWTEGALEIVGKYATQISSNYWAFSLAEAALDEKEVEEAPGVPQTPEPVKVDDNGTVAAADRNGSQVFLWKPTSDSNGNLVVLLPAKFNNLIDGPVTVNGTPGRFTSVANGNRSHWRYDKPGAAFGSNVVVKWTATGKTYTVTVPNGGTRFQTDDVANPVVAPVPTPVTEMPGQGGEAAAPGEPVAP